MAPTFGLAMYNADNLTTMVGNIADSMTNSMRTAQNNITTVNGTALVIETYIHIEWKWLSLPIIISVLSLVLLIVVMTHSHIRGMEGEFLNTIFAPPIITTTLFFQSSTDLFFFSNSLEMFQHATLVLQTRRLE